jgi:hypothetical protein
MSVLGALPVHYELRGTAPVRNVAVPSMQRSTTGARGAQPSKTGHYALSLRFLSMSSCRVC